MRISAALLLALLAPPALAAAPDINIDPDGQIGLIDWGMYSGVDVGVVQAPGTVEGLWHEVDGVRLITQTQTICAGEGTMFGIRYRLQAQPGDAAWAMEVRTEHPLLIAPNGRSGTSGDYTTMLGQNATGYSGWTVRYPYEHVPGDYTFSILHDGVVKLRKTFHLEFECTQPVS